MSHNNKKYSIPGAVSPCKHCLPTPSETIPISTLKNIVKILNQYTLAASVAPCIIHTLLWPWCQRRSKLDLASAEDSWWWGGAYAHAIEVPAQVCTTSVSSGLATRVTLAWVSWGGLERELQWVEPATQFIFYCSMWLFLGFILIGTSCTFTFTVRNGLNQAGMASYLWIWLYCYGKYLYQLLSFSVITFC